MGSLSSRRKRFNESKKYNKEIKRSLILGIKILDKDFGLQVRQSTKKTYTEINKNEENKGRDIRSSRREKNNNKFIQVRHQLDNNNKYNIDSGELENNGNNK